MYHVKAFEIVNEDENKTIRNFGKIICRNLTYYCPDRFPRNTFFHSLYIYFITLVLVNGFTTAQKEPGHRSTVIEENTAKVYGH